MIDMIIVVFQPYCDTAVLQSISCDETYLTLSGTENLQTYIKEEEDPLLITCPFTKTENKVSWFERYIQLLIFCFGSFYSESLMILFCDHQGTAPIGQDKFTEKCCCCLHPLGQQV